MKLHILLLIILVYDTSQLVLGKITVFKINGNDNKSSAKPIKIIYDESIWFNGKRSGSQVILEDQVMEKGLAQHVDVSHCYANIKSPKSKISRSWLLLVSDEMIVCDVDRKILAAQKGGYAGLILYNSDNLGKNYIAKLAIESGRHQIPIFYISYEDGQYLKEIFSNSDHEILYYIRLEKLVPWSTWIMTSYIDSSFHKILLFSAHVIFAVFVVLSEIVMSWFSTAFTIIDKAGFISLILICLPIIILVVAALVSTTRTHHPFFGFHNFGDESERPGAEPDDSDSDSYRSSRDRYETGSSSGYSTRSKTRSRILIHCETLGISSNASFGQARGAYLDLCKSLHSDRTRGRLTDKQVEANEEKLKEVTAAWRELKQYFQPTSSD